MKKITVVAVVAIRKGNTKKVPFVTDVTIRDGERAIATVTLSGRYNAEQALREFKKNPGKFKPFAGWTVEAVATYAMAA